MGLISETECETDGRWLADVPEFPGVLAYGVTEGEAVAKAVSLALRVMADRIECGEAGSNPLTTPAGFQRRGNTP